MKKIKVKLFNKSNNPNPSYATLKSAGMDVLAYLDELVTIKGANSFLQDNKTYCICARCKRPIYTRSLFEGNNVFIDFGKTA